MAQSIFPVPTSTSGDPASQTFAATAAGTYTLSTALAAGVYEVTTDTVQSSHTIAFQTANGYKYTGTIRGGKGYISVASTATKIVIPAGLTYPLNINIVLGAYTQIAAPTGTSLAFTGGPVATITFTAPAGATDMVAYYRDGTATSLATTTSPKTGVAIPVTNGNSGFAMLVAKDANGNIGLSAELTSTGVASIPISGGTASIYSDGGTTYLANTFTSSGTLTVNSVSNIQYLVVAGGGAGSCGGGGAGGMLTGTRSSAATGSFAVTIGAGGAGKSGNRGASGLRGNSGANSVINFGTPLTAIGGGGGGMITNVNVACTVEQRGGDGGSGGGGGTSYNSCDDGFGGAGTAGQGNAGGNGRGASYTAWTRGAGGGGAGAAGANMPDNTTSTAGGIGAQSSLSGTATYYAGGGGGAGGGSTSMPGGLGGGGASSEASGAVSGTANTGGGGGGRNGGQPPGYGTNSSGGSGIVIVRVAL
jgi:hypothetical protein